MDHKQEFGRRLRAAMEAAGYEPRPSVLLDQFIQRHWGDPVSFQTASKWVNGKAIPQQHRLEDIAQWLRIEPQVLRYGEKVPQAVRDARKRWDHGVGYVERETFEAFMRLPVAQRKLLRQIIMTFAENFERPKVPPSKERA